MPQHVRADLLVRERGATFCSMSNMLMKHVLEAGTRHRSTPRIEKAFSSAMVAAADITPSAQITSNLLP